MQHLDLSRNAFNGSLPATLLNAIDLQRGSWMP
jgi:hypothetical protein